MAIFCGNTNAPQKPDYGKSFSWKSVFTHRFEEIKKSGDYYDYKYAGASDLQRVKI